MVRLGLPFRRENKGLPKDIFRGSRRRDIEKRVREIEKAIDKLFVPKVKEVKVTELPKVEVMEVKKAEAERKEEILKPEEKPKEKVKQTQDKKERREEKRVTKVEKTKVEESMGERKEESFYTKGAAETPELHLETRKIAPPREEGQAEEEGRAVEHEGLERIPFSEPIESREEVEEERREERVIELPETKPPKREEKPPEREESFLKPLVDLSMKNILSKISVYEPEESKEPEEERREIEETEEAIDDLADYVFLDEDEPLHDKAISSIGFEKMDYGDVELPRESLRFKPMVEFEPREEELEINIPISNERFEEITFYPVNRPYAYVKILRDKEAAEKIYFVLEPELDEREQRYFDFIRETLDGLAEADLASMEKKGSERYIEEVVDRIIEDYSIRLSEESKKKILYFIKRDTIGYGKIDTMMRDPYIEDISCDGAKVPIFIYHRDHGSMRTNVGFEDEEELSRFVVQLAQKSGRHISIAEPMLDATLPDGSRIQATLGTEVTTRGSTFTIRKFRAIPYSPIELVKMNTLSPEMLVYFWLAVEHGASGIFAGGTGSGKTTTLNAVSLFIPREAKIVSIEETREINLPHPNWIPGVTRVGFKGEASKKEAGEIDMYDLLRAALRQRPEYIIVGEIRGREAYVLFQAMATGHTTYSTMHADSPQSLIRRLEGKPINIPRVMLQSLDFISFQTMTKIKEKRMRRITQIVEIVDIDPVTKEIITNKVFTWDQLTDTFKYSGRSYLLEEIRVKLDLTKDEMMKELNNRIKIIKWMIKNNLTEFEDVARIINEYRDNPKELLKRVEEDG